MAESLRNSASYSTFRCRLFSISSCLTAIAAVALLTGVLLSAGCQDTAMVASLPAANFNGPTIAQQPRPMARVASVQPAAHRRPPVARAAGVPAGWVPPVPPRDWKWIVIHHSATATGDAAVFDAMHRAKGWDELGYDFVIGNGTGSGDGQIEIGPRWTQQKWGAHAKTIDNRYNLYGIGICLVGNFDITYPTPAQIRSLAKLTAYLMRTYHISPRDVLGHRDTKSTDCPGKHMSVAEIRRLATEINVALAGDHGDAVAQNDSARDAAEPAVGTEMLRSAR